MFNFKEFRKTIATRVFSGEAVWWYRANNSGPIPDAIDAEISEYSVTLFDECEMSVQAIGPDGYFGRKEWVEFHGEKLWGITPEPMVVFSNKQLIEYANVPVCTFADLLETTLENGKSFLEKEELIAIRDELVRYTSKFNQAIADHNGN